MSPVCEVVPKLIDRTEIQQGWKEAAKASKALEIS